MESSRGRPTRSNRVLILFAHPAPHRSQVNRRLLAELPTLSGVTLHDLYETYPDMYIDVAAEQAQLLLHDVVVLQFPLFWYSSPAILKEWQDLVLQHGFAYGRDGVALAGKVLVNAVTTGGDAAAYAAAGSNHVTLDALLSPFAATAHTCGMRYLPPFVVHGCRGLNHDRLPAEALRYRQWLTTLVDDIEVPQVAGPTQGQPRVDPTRVER